MPEINDYNIYNKSIKIIQSLYGKNAEFRHGQYEAIEATMTKKRTLVVQRTGWGKSLVYFVCTKLMRENNKGVTMVVSPLLVLMKNQIESADKIGIRCDMLNSETKNRREDILNSLVRDETDLILVTPETLFDRTVQARLKDIKIGLFVIDEAHCISDWGHDFRLEYGNLRTVIARLPANIPVLATTATANNRVVNDLKEQLGNDVYISRGPLTRESLSIQVLKMPSKISRYAWILENVLKLKGNGIIYCLTQRDCDYLSDFLSSNGISCASYYSRDGQDGKLLNEQIEKKFKNNEIKAIIATVKLGMGYDKGDISFVIHFQMPANIVSYYQQIGRAGRNIDRAYAFLMCGKEDEEILNYFIKTAFPTEDETNEIMNFISNNDGVKFYQIVGAVNIRNARIQKALMFLQHDGFIQKEAGIYYATPKKYFYDRSKYDEITRVRILEMEQMKLLGKTTECFSRFISACLDDDTAVDCGHCANCLNHQLISSDVLQENVLKAEEYVNGLTILIKPRKMWIYSNVTKNSKIEYVNSEGICLSKYGDPGYGELVKRDKYSVKKRFCDELVGKSVQVLKDFVRENSITCVCPVPSLRSNIVDDFAMRLAEALNIKFEKLLRKSPTSQQKDMENSSHQCENAFKSFSAIVSVNYPKRVLLVDDIIDSKWTVTVCGYRLMQSGCEAVFPYALADSSKKEV